MKDDKITASSNDLRVNTRPIYFARWPMSGKGGGQHSVVSRTALRVSPFCPIKLSMCSAWGTWCTCIYLVLHLNLSTLSLSSQVYYQVWTPLSHDTKSIRKYSGVNKHTCKSVPDAPPPPPFFCIPGLRLATLWLLSSSFSGSNSFWLRGCL